MSKKNALFNVSLKSHKSNICEDKLDIHCMIKNLGALKHYFEITVVFYFFLGDWLLLSFFLGGGIRVNGIFVIYLPGIEENSFIEHVRSLGNHLGSADSELDPGQVTHLSGLLDITLGRGFSLSHIIRMRPVQLTG